LKFKRRLDYPTVRTVVRSLTICILHQILLGDKIKDMGRELARVWEELISCSVCWRNQKEREHLEDVGVKRRILLKYVLKKQDERMWTRFV